MGSSDEQSKKSRRALEPKRRYFQVLFKIRPISYNIMIFFYIQRTIARPLLHNIARLHTPVLDTAHLPQRSMRDALSCDETATLPVCVFVNKQHLMTAQVLEMIRWRRQQSAGDDAYVGGESRTSTSFSSEQSDQTKRKRTEQKRKSNAIPEGRSKK